MKMNGYPKQFIAIVLKTSNKLNPHSPHKTGIGKRQSLFYFRV
jgi:hypothetical protein